MNVTSRTSRLAAAILTVFSIAILPTAALANHTWGNYHWARTSNPFTLQVGDNVSSAWDRILDTSISDWSASSVLNLTRVAGTVSNLKRCTARSGRVEVCNTTYGNNGWLGIATISASGSHITAGTVKLNDTYYNSPTYNTTAWRNLVMCQEIGHTFGLAHQDENFSNANLGTCMDYTNDPSTNQHPNKHDYDLLEQIYAHTDSSTTIGSAVVPFPMEAFDEQDPGQWGNVIRVSDNGKVLLYERDLGLGNRIFRFVYYVEPRGNRGDNHDH
jgi:hypothetical protein